MESETNATEDKISRKPNFEEIPSTALQHIFSLVTFEEVSRLREVCRAFNEIGKVVLNAGHRRVKHRLRREMARADHRVICPANSRLSYDSVYFLTHMSRAINNCASVYLSTLDIDNFYFIPGKMLDEANHLLQEFNSTTTVPYFVEHVCSQSPHPLLKNFIHLTDRAYSHFDDVIIPTFIFVALEDYLNFTPSMYFEKKDLLITPICQGERIKRQKYHERQKRERKIECGKEMSREFLKMIYQLKTDVFNLTQMQMGEEIARLPEISKVGTKPGESNLHLTTNLKSLGNLVKKRSSKLGNLPSTCVQKILSYFSYGKISLLRMVNKSFDAAGKNLLKKGCESLKIKFQDEVKYEELNHSYLGSSVIDHYEDTTSLFLRCVDLYEWHMGDRYYFVAGKILDALIYFYKGFRVPYFVDHAYLHRPHYCLFQLMDFVNKASNHFKGKIIPKYFRNTQKKVFIPDSIASGYGMSNSRKEDSVIELLKLYKFLEDQEKIIRRQNERNKKYLNIICSLNKTLKTLKLEISERRNLLNEIIMCAGVKITKTD